jgi:phosphonate transport system permease protein
MTSYILPSRRYRQRAALFSGAAVVFVAICFYLDFNPWMLFTEFHYVTDLMKSMLPPDFALVWNSKTIPMAVGETVAMSFLGTLFGGALAIILAFMAATNTMPLSIVRIPVRTFLVMLRVFPSLIIILAFVVAVGLGAFAGMLTLVLGTIGTFGQLFMEIIENTESAPAEAIYSVGASRFQVIRYAILPQVWPSLIANLFYAFDVNIRASIGLGIFGGGGIGFQLFMAMRVLHYRDALALVCLTILLIVLMEKLSDGLRNRLLGRGVLK